jgi:tetratricopeptide (TPR) repeat protein
MSSLSWREKRAAVEKSAEGLKREAEQRPDMPGPYRGLGNLYQASGDLGRAAEYFEKAASMDPRDVYSLNRLAGIYSSWGDLDRAAGSLLEAVKEAPGSPELNYNLACIYARQNRTGDSLVRLKQAVAAGFRDWDRVMGEPDLAGVRNTPGFHELMKNHR